MPDCGGSEWAWWTGWTARLNGWTRRNKRSERRGKYGNLARRRATGKSNMIHGKTEKKQVYEMKGNIRGIIEKSNYYKL